MKTYSITFPSVHGPSGPAFHAEADAPTEERATRAVLEAIAAQGVALDRVVIANVSDLDGAKLDGLKLSNCRLQNVNLQGVSLKDASIADTVFDHVHADRSTTMNGATLESVRFIDCSLNGMAAQGIKANGMRFERGTAIGLDVRNADIKGLRIPGPVRTPAVSWQIAMAWFCNTRDDVFVIDTADATENEKAAARALVHSYGNRAAAQHFFNCLEAPAA